MRMIKSDDWDSQRSAQRNCFPAHLIWIAGFDDIGPLALDDFAHCAQIKKGTVTRRAGNQRRMDRVDTRTPFGDHFRFRAGYDEDVFVVRRVLLDVVDLLVDVALHASAQRRVELSDVADLQEICDSRFTSPAGSNISPLPSLRRNQSQPQ